jgi:DNA-binding MarR family transcriptional regulator
MKNDKNGLEQEFRLGTMLEQAQAAFFSSKEKELAQHNISPMKVAVLDIVQKIGKEATPAEISRWLVRRSHTVSGLLDRMEKDGLISKSKNLPKRNLVRVTITEKGKKALRQSQKRDTEKKIFGSISQKDKTQLFTLLEKIRNKGIKLAGFSTPPYPK